MDKGTPIAEAREVCVGDTASIRGVVRVLMDSELSLGVRLNRSLEFILDKIRGRRGSIMLWDPEKDGLEVVAATNPDIVGVVQAVDPRSISGYAFQTSVPLLIRDINKSDMFRPAAGRGDPYRTDSLLCVPLLGSKRRSIGVINCSEREKDTCFTEDDRQILREYSALISPLVENSCLVDSLAREKDRYQALVRELELKQKELLITHTERSELVQMVVHDFKSPLSAVISNLDLLRYIGISEEQENILDTARNGASKLLEMINDFLQVARLDQWQEQKGRLQPTALLPQVQKAMQEAAPTAEAREINLALDSGAEVRVIAENSLLAHLLSNLLSNAIKYTPVGGDVHVYWDVLDSKRSEDRYDRIVKICVRDSGPGVPDELKKKIFDRFSRAERDKDIQGTGVGLFICNRIVTIMHGRIWVEDAPEGGSVFCVTLYAPQEESDAGQG